MFARTFGMGVSNLVSSCFVFFCLEFVEIISFAKILTRRVGYTINHRRVCGQSRAPRLHRSRARRKLTRSRKINVLGETISNSATKRRSKVNLL